MAKSLRKEQFGEASPVDFATGVADIAPVKNKATGFIIGAGNGTQIKGCLIAMGTGEVFVFLCWL